MSKQAKRVAERYAFDTFAMANLRPDDTGVKGTIIWVSEGEFGGAAAQHGPRIKVYVGSKATADARYKAISVKITDPPVFTDGLPGDIKRMVTKFIEANRQVLLQYWEGELSTSELLSRIQKV